MTAALRVLQDAGRHSYIVFRAGRKYLHAVALTQSISLVTLPIGQRGLVQAILKDRPYPPKRAARIFLKSPLPKTDKARSVLRSIVKSKESAA